MRLLAALVLLALPACDVPVASTDVVLVVQHESDCDALDAVHEAADAWNDVADVGLSVQGCEVADYPLHVTAREDESGTFDASVHLDGLELHEGELPIFLVDSIEAHYGDGREDSLTGIGVRHGCAQGIAIVEPRPALIAHELGHLMWLAHDDRAGNLMESSPVDSAWWIDAEQIERAESMATACS